MMTCLFKRGAVEMALGLGLGLATALATSCRTAGSRTTAAEQKQLSPGLSADADDMRWWREARFGLFIHWGPVSLRGTEISWSRGGERRGTGGSPGQIPPDVYDNLYHQFDPTNFNAKAWVAVARAAGMRYLVFTTKHHDGFCEFDSRLTDYKITRAPFQRDVVKELADACHRAGLRLGFYYSPPDWHHPDYRTPNHGRYVDYLHGQLAELCSRYGRVDIIWFDGLGGSAVDWDSTNLFRLIRRRQPHILINNRAGLPGDFDTPEQDIGKFQKNRAWESCITLGEQWAWKPDDAMKPLKQCLQTLLRCAGGDGNLLFNVGPDASGAIEPRQAARLKEIGQWLGHYGQSVYRTRGGPFHPGDWGVSTCRGKRVYLHIFQHPAAGLTLPPLGTTITSWKVLTGGKADVTQTAERLSVTIPERDRQDIDTVVELRLARRADQLAPLR